MAPDLSLNYSYDNQGNLTRKTTISSGAYTTYTWDYRNRLTDVENYNPSNVLQSHVHYTYDVFNRLIQKQTDPTGGGTYTITQIFVYDASPGAAVPGVALVFNGSGTMTDRVLNGPGDNDALADENGSGTVSWFLKDREGTTNDVVQYNPTTDTTTVVDHLTYGSFGDITAQTNSAYQPLFAYTGQIWDSATGLYYYHARWYDPAAGRFISQDPAQFAAGDANLYRYVGNNPVNLTDPTGHDAESSTPPASAESQAQLGIQQSQEQIALGEQNARAAGRESDLEIRWKQPNDPFGPPRSGVELELSMRIAFLKYKQAKAIMEIKAQEAAEAKEHANKMEAELTLMLSFPLVPYAQIERARYRQKLAMARAEAKAEAEAEDRQWKEYLIEELMKTIRAYYRALQYEFEHRYDS